MSIGRITMLEFVKPEDVDAAEAYYEAVREDFFPTLELVLNVRTGPTSLMSIAVYPSYQAAEANLPQRQKFHEHIQATIKDTFYYEGDISHFYHKPSSLIVCAVTA